MKLKEFNKHINTPEKQRKYLVEHTYATMALENQAVPIEEIEKIVDRLLKEKNDEL